MSRRAGSWKGSRIPLRVFRSRLAQQCQHQHHQLVPEGHDYMVVICSACGLVMDEIERTELMTD